MVSFPSGRVLHPHGSLGSGTTVRPLALTADQTARPPPCGKRMRPGNDPGEWPPPDLERQIAATMSSKLSVGGPPNGHQLGHHSPLASGPAGSRSERRPMEHSGRPFV